MEKMNAKMFIRAKDINYVCVGGNTYHQTQTTYRTHRPCLYFFLSLFVFFLKKFRAPCFFTHYYTSTH